MWVPPPTAGYWINHFILVGVAVKLLSPLLGGEVYYHSYLHELFNFGNSSSDTR